MLKLDEKNPVRESGKRKFTFHQFLNEVGRDVLTKHLDKVVTIGEVRNPKGRGAEKLTTKLSFSEVLEKAMNVKG